MVRCAYGGRGYRKCCGELRFKIYHHTTALVVSILILLDSDEQSGQFLGIFSIKENDTLTPDAHQVGACQRDATWGTQLQFPHPWLISAGNC